MNKFIDDMDLEGTMEYYKAKVPSIRVTGSNSINWTQQRSVSQFEKHHAEKRMAKEK